MSRTTSVRGALDPVSSEDDEIVEVVPSIPLDILIPSVYWHTWKEFYHSKKTVARDKLAALAGPLPDAPPPLLPADWDLVSGVPGTESATTLEPEILDLRSSLTLQPHERYEMIAPSNVNIAWRPLELDYSTTLAFIPYADDPDFEQEAYVSVFPKLLWMDDMIDPDHEIIQYETLRRLVLRHRLSMDTVDEAGILPPLRSNAEGGLLWDVSQRDLLPWPGDPVFPDAPLPARTYFPDAMDLPGRTEWLRRHFCPNLNCLQFRCLTHVDTGFDPRVKKPTITNAMWLERAPDMESCGSECFALRTFDPETMARTRIYPDDHILAGMEDGLLVDGRGRTNQMYGPVDVVRAYPWSNESRFSGKTGTLVMCNHPGLRCKDDAQEIILKHDASTKDYAASRTIVNVEGGGRAVHVGERAKKMAKTRSCHASTIAPAPVTKRAWNVTQRCASPAIVGYWELRPDSDRGRHCQNSNIQRQIQEPLCIKPGLYGLGAFSTSAIPKGRFLGEYTGDLANPAEQEEAAEILEKYGMNYKFSLTEDRHTVDAATVGNETRFLNHRSKNPDVVARIVLVNNVLRIGFFAERNIKAGKELFLDYGEGFFKHYHPG
ncbi:hypothetical protein PUNSTDRAFT_124288 [Punctularia strigosozonata HHB-11173 SS5]|uniref:uncharacterized protein n=1 Tax=Punctularia strigosozonata (strain HHB-11173) TaxID=741275 RepID=UPI000441838D|nr:uncharacterized protein PUNSTDRAFT_124288 [Punctularia strigosozonata HHB-11173 SS5]EIN12427.1 hypothetical protein PUNSTDRAFT_124288 [Punctularia strigosozonata HHB-11173 SS5]